MGSVGARRDGPGAGRFVSEVWGWRRGRGAYVLIGRSEADGMGMHWMHMHIPPARERGGERGKRETAGVGGGGGRGRR